jgi:hypothetical protein
MKKSRLLCSLVAVLSLVIWMTGSAQAGWDVDPPITVDTPCCQELQNQPCGVPNEYTTYCHWGAYGSGWCRCAGTWGCVSNVPVPNEPVC